MIRPLLALALTLPCFGLKLSTDWTAWLLPLSPGLITAGFLLRAFCRSVKIGIVMLAAFGALWGYVIWKFFIVTGQMFPI